MSTLLLRLAGPMQSWGTVSRFSLRDTGLEPSKSGVAGLLCAALGRPRHASVDDLAALRMGVRVDHEGAMMVDYHTAGGTHRRGDTYGVAKASGGAGDTVVSRRYYLADADFLVGIEGSDTEFLQTLYAALIAPRWQLCLGRKSFVPATPVAIADGLRTDVALKTALVAHTWRPRDSVTTVETSDSGASPAIRLRFVFEADARTGDQVVPDQPLGAAFRDRTFTIRHVRTAFLSPSTIATTEQE